MMFHLTPVSVPILKFERVNHSECFAFAETVSPGLANQVLCPVRRTEEEN